jgi:hypothetical protein
MGNEVATIDQGTDLEIPREIVTPARAAEIAKMMQDARCLPDGYNGDVRKAAIAILHGQEVGLSPMQSVRGIYIVRGTPTIWGDALVGLCHREIVDGPHAEFYGGVEGDPGFTCRVWVVRKGRPTPISAEFTWGMAVTAKLIGKAGPWSQYPRDMMRRRALATVMRLGFADLLCGLSVREEIEDIPVTRETVEVQQLLHKSDEPAPDVDAEAVRQAGFEAASLGRTALREWYKSLSPAERKVANEVKDELGAAADKAGAPVAEAVDVAE